MTAFSWATSVSNDWANAQAWTPSGGPPISTSAVTIGATGANYIVAVDSSDAANSLTISSANATVNVFSPGGALTIAGALNLSAGILDIGTSASPSGAVTVGGAAKIEGGTLNVNQGGSLSLTGKLSDTAGQLNLNAGGTISGGSLGVTTGVVNFDGGTLSGVTYDGTLNLTATGASVHLANGAKVVATSGSGTGTVNVTAKNAILYFDNTQTVSNTTIKVGASAGSATVALNHVFNSENASETLTLASTTTVDFTGYGALTGGNFFGDGIVNQGLVEQTAGLSAGIAGSSFTNAGTLTASDAGGSFAIDTNAFTNSGTINISNGDQLVLASTNSTTLSATSAISVGAKSTLTIGESFGSATWSNLGSITLASKATLDLGGEFTLADVGTITNSGGSVYVTGTLNNTGETLDGSGALGAVTLDGGTVLGGIVKSAGVKFASGVNGDNFQGTLSDVTFYGPLDLSGKNQSVVLTAGTTVVGSSGTGPGVINITGASDQLNFEGSQTVSNLTVKIGGKIGNETPSFSTEDNFGASTALTLASTATLDFVGDAILNAGFNPGDNVVNQGLIEQTAAGSANVNGISFTNSGTINASAAGGDLWIGSTTFVNSGTINVSNDDQLTLASNSGTTTTLSDTSQISIGAGGLVQIGALNNPGSSMPSGSWSNLGSITLASGSTLEIGGTFTLATLGTVTNNGGTVDVEGTLNNTGQTLDGSGGLGPLTLDQGTVEGGIVTAAGVSFAPGFFGNSVNTLDDVAFEGPLNLASENDDLALSGGTTIVGSSGSGPGVVNETGSNDQLEFVGAQTVSNLTVNLGSSFGNPQVVNQDDTGAGQTLTLAASTIVDFVGSGTLSAGNFSGDSIVNQGLIDQTGSLGFAQIQGSAFTNAGTLDEDGFGGNFQVNSSAFANAGTIEVSNEGFFNFNSQTNFTNLASGTLTGGTYDIAGGSIQVDTSGVITTLDASVTLSGGGSFFDAYNQPTNTSSSLDSTLTSVGSTGALSLLDDRGWTTSGAAITDKGVITLGGGAIAATVTGASLTIGAGGKLAGFGAVAANSLTNSGTIEASGAQLQLNSAVTGKGTLQVDGGAELVANDSLASTQTVSFQGSGGSLALFGPNTYDGSIDGFTAGDTLLTSANFVSFVENTAGTSGTLTLSSGTTAEITLVGDYVNANITHVTNGAITTIGYT